MILAIVFQLTIKSSYIMLPIMFVVTLALGS
jgi:hypothetical protein